MSAGGSDATVVSCPHCRRSYRLPANRPIPAGAPEVIAEGPPGAQETCVLQCDFDGNGGVGLTDFNILVGHWGQPVPACTLGDCDCNGGVGLTDFNLLNAEWGKSCPQ